MPDTRIADHQVNKFKEIRTQFSQEATAAKVGMSVRNARRIEKRASLSSQRGLRTWRTRHDSRAEVWEPGHLPRDTGLQQRAHKLQARRRELLLEITGLKRETKRPLKALNAVQVEAFGRALKARLGANRPFAKQYLRLLVSEIRLAGRKLEMRGSYGALAHAVAEGKPGTPARVPGFASGWLPKQGNGRRYGTIPVGPGDLYRDLIAYLCSLVCIGIWSAPARAYCPTAVIAITGRRLG